MKILMAYYSRTGVTQAAAQAIAVALKESGDVEVTLEEIADTKPRKGAMGCLGAVKDVLLRKQTVIAPPATDPADFDLLVIGSPVWAFRLATPVQTYCGECGMSADKFAVFCTMGGSGDEKTFRNAEDILGRPPVATLSLIDRHVKAGDQQQFLDKAKAFAGEIIASQAASPPTTP